jgi:hypothetical protein
LALNCWTFIYFTKWGSIISILFFQIFNIWRISIQNTCAFTIVTQLMVFKFQIYIDRISLLWIILCWTLTVGMVSNSSHIHPNLAHKLSLYNFLSRSIPISQFHFSILKLLWDCTIYHLAIMHKIIMIIIFCCVHVHACVLLSNCDVATLVDIYKTSKTCLGNNQLWNYYYYF